MITAKQLYEREWHDLRHSMHNYTETEELREVIFKYGTRTDLRQIIFVNAALSYLWREDIAMVPPSYMTESESE